MATINVGVTGHRDLGGDRRIHWRVHAECIRLLLSCREIAKAQSRNLVAFSALAQGADQIFAKAALGLQIPLFGLCPFATYHEDFEPGGPQELLQFLYDCCEEVKEFPTRDRSEKAYWEAGKWMVNQCQYVVAVWNGKPSKGKGGTAGIVAYAEELGKPVLRIDPMQLGSE